MIRTMTDTSAALAGRTMQVGDSSFSKAAKYEPPVLAYSGLAGEKTFPGNCAAKIPQSIVLEEASLAAEQEDPRGNGT